MFCSRRVARFASSPWGKLLLRLALPLYLIQCLLLFSGELIHSSQLEKDATLHLQLLSLQPDINLMSYPNTSDVQLERSIAPRSSAVSLAAVRVAIGLAITSKSLANITPYNISESFVFFKDFLPSFCRTRSTDRKYGYTFYVGYDDVDWYLGDPEGRLYFENTFAEITQKHCGGGGGDVGVELRMVACIYTAKPAWAQNDAMMEAYIDNADYYYRINDDIILTSANWTSLFVERLARYAPPDVGVVAPLHSGGNQRHMEFDFVHRTHVDIFGTYYPRAFLDLYGDIWMGWVYAPGRAEKLPMVTLNHTQASGKRYDEGKSGGGARRRFQLRPELARGRSLLQKYLNSTLHGAPSQPRNGRRVISTSLPVGSPRYVNPVISYANRARVLLPEWTVRLYVAQTTDIANRVLLKLYTLGVEVIRINSPAFTNKVPHELWKYLVVADRDVDEFFIRRTEGNVFNEECELVRNWTIGESTRNPVYCVPDPTVKDINYTTLPVPSCTWVGTVASFRNDSVIDYFSQKMIDFSNRFAHNDPGAVTGAVIERYFSASTLGTLAEKYNVNQTVVDTVT